MFAVRIIFIALLFCLGFQKAIAASSPDIDLLLAQDASEENCQNWLNIADRGLDHICQCAGGKGYCQIGRTDSQNKPICDDFWTNYRDKHRLLDRIITACEKPAQINIARSKLGFDYMYAFQETGNVNYATRAIEYYEASLNDNDQSLEQGRQEFNVSSLASLYRKTYQPKKYEAFLIDEAKNGNIEAQTVLGKNYYEGKFLKRDLDKAVSYFQQSLALPDNDANESRIWLAKIYADKANPYFNPNEAVSLAQQAIEHPICDNLTETGLAFTAAKAFSNKNKVTDDEKTKQLAYYSFGLRSIEAMYDQKTLRKPFAQVVAKDQGLSVFGIFSSEELNYQAAQAKYKSLYQRTNKNLRHDAENLAQTWRQQINDNCDPGCE